MCITNGNACFVCHWVNLRDPVCTTVNITFVIYYIFTLKTVLVYKKKNSTTICKFKLGR